MLSVEPECEMVFHHCMVWKPYRQRGMIREPQEFLTRPIHSFHSGAHMPEQSRIEELNRKIESLRKEYRLLTGDLLADVVFIGRQLGIVGGSMFGEGDEKTITELESLAAELEAEIKSR